MHFVISIELRFSSGEREISTIFKKWISPYGRNDILATACSGDKTDEIQLGISIEPTFSSGEREISTIFKKWISPCGRNDILATACSSTMIKKATISDRLNSSL